MADYAEDWLAVEKELGERPLLRGTAEEIKQVVATLPPVKLEYPGNPETVTSTDRTIKSSDGADIKIRIYQPKEVFSQSGSVANRPLLPLGFHTHGGGLVLGDLDIDDPLLLSLSSALPAVIVQVDYRLAPEHRWPKQFEDAYAGYQWAIAHAEELGGDLAKVFLSGDSSGGHLAAAVALRARDEGKPVKGQVLFQPWLVAPAHLPDEEREKFGRYSRIGTDAAFVNSDTVDAFWAASKPENVADHGYVFPYLHGSLEGLPKTFITFNGEDVLGDHGEQYALRLKESGVPVRTKIYPGYPHGWFLFPQLGQNELFFNDFKTGTEWVLEP